MATEEKIVYSVEVEGADKAADDFQRVVDELDRLTALHEKTRGAGGAELFTAELAKSIDWLMPAVKKYARELEKLDKPYAAVVYRMNEHADAAKKVAAETAKVTTETKKTGEGFSFAGGKALKFFGALGLGVYSLYSLASALRRGLRAIGDFIREGVEKAIAADATLKAQTESLRGEVERFTLVLGSEMTPGLKEVTSALGNLVQTLHETGAIEAFGQLLSAMLIGAARGLDALATGADNLRDVVNRIQAEMPAAPDWEEVGRHVKAATPGATAAMLPLGAASILPSALTAPFAAADWVRGAGEVEERPVYGEKGQRIAYQEEHARATRPKKPKVGKKKPDISFAKYRASRERLGGFAALREMDAYREKSSAETWGGTPDELAAKSAEIKKSLTKTKMEIDADAAKAAADNAKVKGAYAKMWTETIAGAARSGDVKGAFTEIAISMGVKIAAAMVAGGIASSFAEGGFGKWFKTFLFAQETAHVPGNASAGGIPAIVHPGEYILDESRVQALRAGYGVTGGKGEYNYTIQPASPNVEVHLHPGVDADVQTALRARAGEAKLAGMEA